MSKIAGKVAALLRPDVINLNLHARQKEDALREVATLLQKAGCVSNFDAFFSEILERERVSNTALGHDVAIPHARTEQCAEILIAVGRSAEESTSKPKTASRYGSSSSSAPRNKWSPNICGSSAISPACSGKTNYAKTCSPPRRRHLHQAH